MLEIGNDGYEWHWAWMPGSSWGDSEYEIPHIVQQAFRKGVLGIGGGVSSGDYLSIQ